MQFKEFSKGSLEEHLRQVGSVVYFLTIFSSTFKKLQITIQEEVIRRFFYF